MDLLKKVGDALAELTSPSGLVAHTPDCVSAEACDRERAMCAGRWVEYERRSAERARQSAERARERLSSGERPDR